jgi:hypothetical protein
LRPREVRGSLPVHLAKIGSPPVFRAAYERIESLELKTDKSFFDCDVDQQNDRRGIPSLKKRRLPQIENS